MRILTTETGEECDYYTIQEIIVYEDVKIFNLNKLYIKSFDNKMCAFKVEVTDSTLAIEYQSLLAHGILHLKNKHGESYIIEKDNSIHSLWTYIL